MKYLYYSNITNIGLAIRNTDDINIVTDSTSTIGIYLIEEEIETKEITDEYVTNNNLMFLEINFPKYINPGMFRSQSENLILVIDNTIQLIPQPNEFFIPSSTFQEWIVYPNLVRRKRSQYLKISDWTQIPDSPLSSSDKTDYANWRQYLRDRPANISVESPDLLDFDEWKATQ